MKNIFQGIIGEHIKLTDFKDKTEILLNSPGGDLFEGLAMYDFVKDSDISVGVIGVCASAATLPLMASSKSFGTPNSRFLIHNPLVEVRGNAVDLKTKSDSLSAEQERALSLYTTHLTISREEIVKLMSEERFLSAEEALSIGLIKEIRPLNKEIKKIDAVQNLYLNYKMEIDMSENSELKNELSGFKKSISSMIAEIKNLITAPRLLVIQDVNGTEIDFGDAVETEEQIAVGATATVDGAPANGEFITSNEKLVFENGTLTEKSPLENETEALRAENENLKAELEVLKTEMKASKSTIEMTGTKLLAIEKKFSEFKMKFSDDSPTMVVPDGEKEEVKKFTYKRK